MFLGQVNYLRFISNLVGTTKVFFDLIMPKEVEEFKWQEQHQTTFNEIKGYLSKPPVLRPPLRGRPLKLYLSVVKEFIGCLLAQNNSEGREQVVYYLSPQEILSHNVGSARYCQENTKVGNEGINRKIGHINHFVVGKLFLVVTLSDKVACSATHCSNLLYSSMSYLLYPQLFYE